MTTEEINKIAMQQSAVELGCKTEDFFQNENKLVSSVCSNKARKLFVASFFQPDYFQWIECSNIC